MVGPVVLLEPDLSADSLAAAGFENRPDPARLAAAIGSTEGETGRPTARFIAL